MILARVLMRLTVSLTSAFCVALLYLSAEMVLHDHSTDERILGVSLPL